MIFLLNTGKFVSFVNIIENYEQKYPQFMYFVLHSPVKYSMLT